MTTLIASSIEITKFAFAYLFCRSMNKKLLQYVYLHKQKLNVKNKFLELILQYIYILN